MAGIALAVAHDSRRESALGEVTKYSVRLAWQDALRRPSFGLVVLALVVLYGVGAVLVARPYCADRRTLLIAVPIAAVISLLVLGAAALLIYLVAALGDGDGCVGFDVFPDMPDGPRRRRPTPDGERRSGGNTLT